MIHPGFITSSSLMDNVPEKLLVEGFAMATEANGGDSPNPQKLSMEYSPSSENQADDLHLRRSTGRDGGTEKPSTRLRHFSCRGSGSFDRRYMFMSSFVVSYFDTHFCFSLLLSFSVLTPILLHSSTPPLFNILPNSSIGSSGSFLRDCRLMTSPVKPWAQGKENADRLWKLSEKLVGENFPN